MAPKTAPTRKRALDKSSIAVKPPSTKRRRVTTPAESHRDTQFIERTVPTGSGVFKPFTTPPPRPTSDVKLEFLQENSVNKCLTEVMQWLLINPRCLDVYFKKSSSTSTSPSEKAKIDTYMRKVLKTISEKALYTLHYECNCAVFDIDDTIIKSTSPENHPELVDPGILQLYYLLLGRGWHIFFITARTEDPDVRKFTENQLTKLGFHVHNNVASLGDTYSNRTGVSNLILMPESTDLSADECNFSYYKYYARRLLRAIGYVIGINIGDNYNDLLITPPWIYDSTLACDKSGPHGCMMNTIQNFIFFGSPNARQKLILAEHNGAVIVFGIEDACISIKLPAVE